MQILGLLGMYFDAVVVEVKTFLLLFRLALAILCLVHCKFYSLPTNYFKNLCREISRQSRDILVHDCLLFCHF